MEEKVANRGVVALVAAVISTLLLLLLLPPFGAAAATRPGRSDCTRSCGNISIPYPFGLEAGCYHAAGFNLTCNHTYQPPKLFLGEGTMDMEVLSIFLSNNTVLINSNPMEFKNDGGDDNIVNTTWEIGFPYYLPLLERNILLHAQGCGFQVNLLGGVQQNNLISSCTAMCSSPSYNTAMEDQSFINECTGIGCCQLGFVPGYSRYIIQIHYLKNVLSSNQVVIYMIDEDEVQELLLPVATLDWVISNSTCPTNGSAPECLSAHALCSNSTAQGHDGYICECVDGYQGNPYELGGCQVPVNPCEHQGGYTCYGDCLNIDGSFYCQCPKKTYGDPFTKDGCSTTRRSFAGLNIGLGFGGSICILFIALGGPFILRKIKLQKAKMVKEKFFKQNHGLLLQQLVSQKADIGERMIMSLGELEKATNNFDRARVIGGGGHGIVFKGIIDLHVVAIKKSKIVVQREINEFINEVAVLSQVNHRNVVKLLGCCLEAEVPLLVYEFISNGTLYHHLHVEGPVSIPWYDRIRIALEVAKALSYLHSATSMPIFHRDIKSSNILLDYDLTAKVSDFGASRYIPIDKTGITSAVQGTIGYLDPMYYYTGRLTNKSDVFSFGVLLIELLTRKKPYVYRSVDDDGIVSYFASLHAKGNVVDIIDPQVIEEEDGEIQDVAMLAVMCTKLKGEDRPTMREVEMALENLLYNKTYSGKSTRDDGSEITGHYTSGGRSHKEASRQYTMEREMLLSSSYGR